MELVLFRRKYNFKANTTWIKFFSWIGTLIGTNVSLLFILDGALFGWPFFGSGSQRGSGGDLWWGCMKVQRLSTLKYYPSNACFVVGHHRAETNQTNEDEHFWFLTCTTSFPALQQSKTSCLVLAIKTRLQQHWEELNLGSNATRKRE